MSSDSHVPVEPNSIQETLAASPPVMSLRAEQEVAGILRSCSWRTIHGFYYPDPEEEKTREMDVVGSRSWEGDVGSEREGAGVSVLIECKSARDYHIVFPALAESPQPRFPEWWAGWQESTRDPITRVMLARGMPREIVARILHAFKEIAWPDNTSFVASYRACPMPPKYTCSTFCETNTKAGRRPGESVLWKAGAGLRSAVRGLQRQRLEWLCQNLGATLDNLDDPADSASAALDLLAWSVRFVTLYNPVVVIDSALWVLDGDSVRPVPSFRFLQHDAYGTVDWWFDVVNRADFADYACDFTSYMMERMNHVGARPIGGSP